MYFVYFDSGTTNSRVYLINNYRVVDLLQEHIGSKESSIYSDNKLLIKRLKELFDHLLKKNNIKDKEIKAVYASGLLTSHFGFKEIPHLITPVSINELTRGIYVYFEPLYFKREINLIRGVKTIASDFQLNRENFDFINNIRGEEIEVFGILSELDNYREDKNVVIILPGSHTQLINVKKNNIQDILSTFSGELFYAIYSCTILSNSINHKIEQLDQDMVLLGFDTLKKHGINRALYLVHTLQLFSDFSKKEITSFLQGIITGGVIQAFTNISEKKWTNIGQIIIAGNNILTEPYMILFKKQNLNLNIIRINNSGNESFAVKGFYELLKTRGC